MKKIVFFVFPDRAACFQLAQKKWMCEKINSEDWSPSTLGIPDLLKELSERLNSGSELATVELYLVYERSAISYLKDVPEALTALGCTCWQILRWEPLLHRATGVRGSKPEDIFDCKWLTDTMLPVLESTFNYTDQAFDAERGRVLQAHEETMESLRTEKQQLIQEKAALQAQIEALRLQDIEHLFAFLPAIYRNFWGVISPDELSLLAGNLQTPTIQSPFSEPSASTVAMKKRQLQNLPEQDRSRILGFCRQLTHKLEVRAEMRDLLEGDV